MHVRGRIQANRALTKDHYINEIVTFPRCDPHEEYSTIRTIYAATHQTPSTFDNSSGRTHLYPQMYTMLTQSTHAQVGSLPMCIIAHVGMAPLCVISFLPDLHNLAIFLRFFELLPKIELYMVKYII